MSRNDFKGDRRPVAYYISAHGYGHGVRSIDILKALHALHSQQAVIVTSGFPKEFFNSRLGPVPYLYRTQAFDTGLVQFDSIRCDPKATLSQLENLYLRRRELIDQEASFLRVNRVGLVVVDIPGLPLEAAERAGIPRLAVGNFGWDWLYSFYIDANPRWKPLVEILQEEYFKTDLLLRLPFCEEMKAFPRIEDIPLVASAGRNRRKEIADKTHCSISKRWVLLSFTALDWDESALDRVNALDQYEFFAVLPLYWRRRNIHCLDRTVVPFADVLASVDGVVSKPGFGILSECVVNHKPLLYTDRADFAEYAILKKAIKNHLKHHFIPSELLYKGDLGDALAKLWDCPEPRMTVAQGGAPIAARRMMDYLA